ncbi:PadR family transcriptional regulator [Saccharibacillus sacchari]|uniref:PadR family transcriptional regulator n=1 Tax=Saccharibacillus sacchari TaxID=456493 RepID=A0ACC6PA37_9BACL
MYADILILGQLLSGPKHGYEIKKSVQEALGDSFGLNNNALYPALRRFAEAGAITKETEKGDGKPDRHVYVLTQSGETTFTQLVCDFSEKAAVHQMEFLVRVALFGRLRPENRLAILEKRLAAIEEQSGRNRKFDRQGDNDLFIAEVIEFQKQQTEHERVWIERLIRETRDGK